MNHLFGKPWCPGISHYSMENTHGDLNKCKNLLECKGNSFAEDNFSSSTKLVAVDNSLDIQFLDNHVYWQLEGCYPLLTEEVF